MATCRAHAAAVRGAVLSRYPVLRKGPEFGALVISRGFELRRGVRYPVPADRAYRANVFGVRRAVPEEALGRPGVEQVANAR